MVLGSEVAGMGEAVSVIVTRAPIQAVIDMDFIFMAVSAVLGVAALVTFILSNKDKLKDRRK